MRSQARVWFLTVVCGLVLGAVLAAAAQASPIAIEKFVATNCKVGHSECGEEKIAETEETVLEEGAPKTVKFKFFEPKAKITVEEAEHEGFVEAGGRVPYGAVGANFSTGTVTPVTSLPLCVSALLPDGKGDKVYAAVGAAQPNPEGGEFPTSTWLTADQKTLTPSTAVDTGTHGPVWPALDSTHQVVVEASLYESGVETDNNAMSEITVLNPATGKVLARHAVANLVDSTVAGSNFDFTGRQGLFLDPHTRTGWVVNGWGTGLEQFSY